MINYDSFLLHAIPKATYRKQDVGFSFHSVNGNLTGYEGLPETERTLLIWQVTGKQQQALVEQETAFVDSLRTGSA
jgi:hypothetical protein